ncbi:MAG: transcriptional regulator, hxlr family protein [Acidimicrobiales bacterium]|nr:transcriptional regulator, hxlr family protein [Acidimicrobiales bacterium]
MSQSTSVPTARRALVDPKSCSIGGALDALGDSWSILVLRELFYGVRRFNDIQNDLGISRSVLTERLARLVEVGVARTEAYQEPGDRVRKQYRLTRKGVRLLPVMVALMEWGDEYLCGGEGPVTLEHRDTGETVHVELRTVSGTPVEPSEIITKARKRRPAD